MTTIHTTLETLGGTTDGVNYENEKEFKVIIYKHDNHGEVVAEWDNNVYTLDDIKGLLVDMEHVDKRTS
ncbi:hypothetical protein VP496E541_P0177 [Vibrio phage 496E54-1]|nr:hypothetical protein VP495E541_P0177 [Vibrio phage 495E54-1]CAH9014258.1 hypothetical protein VP496E541_P0177 [Vibrio phage 496E54-1]